jgi:hypothetical protein
MGCLCWLQPKVVPGLKLMVVVRVTRGVGGVAPLAGRTIMQGATGHMTFMIFCSADLRAPPQTIRCDTAHINCGVSTGLKHPHVHTHVGRRERERERESTCRTKS